MMNKQIFRRQEDVAMETSNLENVDDNVTRFVDRAIMEQVSECERSYSDLDEWHCPSLDLKNYWRLLHATAIKHMCRRGVYHKYEVDDNNRDIIRQMYFYTAGSSNCSWNINKGIYLGGKIGCGKTILMLAFCEVLGSLTGKVIEMIPANQLYKRIQLDGLNSLAKRPLLIDELGREQVEVNDYGNRTRPINELMELRYETGARTFFTSNFKISTLSKEYNDKGVRQGYGEYIGERIREMVNMVILPGESRRERWEAK